MLARQLAKKYPHVLMFARTEAVMLAEDTTGLSPAIISKNYRMAASKLKKLIPRLRSVNPTQRVSIRNEYYWFSKQPYKQYLLGREQVAKGLKRAYYSQGVGAERLARQYALKGRKGLSLRWAKRAEKAWLHFFKGDARWFNSYFFYAACLGYQGRFKEMDWSFQRAAKIAGKSSNWKNMRAFRAEVLETCRVLNLRRTFCK